MTRPCQIAASAALAAWKLRRKVHLAVTRDDDLRMNGGENLRPFIIFVHSEQDARLAGII